MFGAGEKSKRAERLAASTEEAGGRGSLTFLKINILPQVPRSLSRERKAGRNARIKAL